MRTARRIEFEQGTLFPPPGHSPWNLWLAKRNDGRMMLWRTKEAAQVWLAALSRA